MSLLSTSRACRPERRYLCRRRESEGHLSGGRVGVTARVSQRGDRATKEKPRCHHLYHGEATRPLQHGNTQASDSLSTQTDSQSVRQCAADRTRARATFPVRPCEDCGADGTCIFLLDFCFNAEVTFYSINYQRWRVVKYFNSAVKVHFQVSVLYLRVFFRTLLLHNVPKHNIVGLIFTGRFILNIIYYLIAL